MAVPSHNARPNGPALSSNDDTWDSGYSEVAWTNPACYPTPAMAVGQHWLHHGPHNNSNPGISPVSASPCSNPTITPPSSYHHPNCIPWPVGSPNGYILPDAHNAACHPNTPKSTPMARISSFNSSPEEPLDTANYENTCGHGAGAQSRQAAGIDVNHYGRYKCRWEGCTYTSTFSRQTCLWRHIKSTHVAPEEFKCPVRDCKESFGRKDKLQSHMRLCHITHGRSESCSCHS
ncbi:unnamed protein product [Penicillium pancosmium]